MQAEAREQVGRPVAAEEIAAPDLEERARRQIQFVGGSTARGDYRHHPSFEPAADADSRGRRLVDRDQQIASGLVAVPQFTDPHAPEQSQTREAPLALVDRREAERLPRLNLQLAFDRGGGGADVAHVQHVVDQHLRSFANGELNGDLGVVLHEDRRRVYGGVFVPEGLIRHVARFAGDGAGRARRGPWAMASLPENVPASTIGGTPSVTAMRAMTGTSPASGGFG